MLKEIVSKLELIEGSLDDAYYSLPDWEKNSDGKSSIDSARDELYSLKADIEKFISVAVELGYQK